MPFLTKSLSLMPANISVVTVRYVVEIIIIPSLHYVNEMGGNVPYRISALCLIMVLSKPFREVWYLYFICIVLFPVVSNNMLTHYY